MSARDYDAADRLPIDTEQLQDDKALIQKQLPVADDEVWESWDRICQILELAEDFL